jgi:hypothetical protein
MPPANTAKVRADGCRPGDGTGIGGRDAWTARSGKSRLLRAGLLPQLTTKWMVVEPFMLEDAPVYALVKAAAATVRPVSARLVARRD